MPMLPSVYNFKQWIADNRHLLKPPVGNYQVWRDLSPEFIIMVVGGPNSRKDYHINQSEEFFYQLEGDIVLNIIENGTPKAIPLKEGDIFLLPPNIPHSPQRKAGTIGLVVERKRKPEELDQAVWFCEQCHKLMYKKEFALKDISTELKKIFEEFYGTPANRTCKSCGAVMEPPTPVN